MEDNELLSVLKNFIGKKTTFKELAEIFGFEINLLIDEINRLEQEEKLKYLPLGDGKIRIADTCPLGNKQYLVIAQCDQEKFLLGVSPNGFHHITNLKNEDSEMKPSNEPKKPISN